MLGPWQIAIIVLLVLVLFGGRGKISAMMGDLAGGIKAFKKGLADDDEKPGAQADPAKLADRGEGAESAMSPDPQEKTKS